MDPKDPQVEPQRTCPQEEIPTLVDNKPPMPLPPEAYPEDVWDELTEVEIKSLTW